MDLNLINWLLALLPVLAVLLLMVGLGWGGSRAGLAGFFVALILSLTVFGGEVQLVLVAIGKSIFLAVDVLYIVWMALFFYNVTNEAGAVALIGRSLQRLTFRPRRAELAHQLDIRVALARRRRFRRAGGGGRALAGRFGLHGHTVSHYGGAGPWLGGDLRLLRHLICRLDRRHGSIGRGTGARRGAGFGFGRLFQRRAGRLRQRRLGRFPALDSHAAHRRRSYGHDAVVGRDQWRVDPSAPPRARWRAPSWALSMCCRRCIRAEREACPAQAGQGPRSIGLALAAYVHSARLWRFRPICSDRWSSLWIRFASRPSSRLWRPALAGVPRPRAGAASACLGMRARFCSTRELQRSCCIVRAGYYESPSVWSDIWAKVRRSAHKVDRIHSGAGGDGGLDDPHRHDANYRPRHQRNVQRRALSAGRAIYRHAGRNHDVAATPIPTWSLGRCSKRQRHYWR